MHMKNHHRRHALAIALSTMYALGSPSVQANPTGAQVVAGQAAIAAQGNLLTVTNSAGAIINWRGFSGSRALRNAWLWGIAVLSFVAIFVFDAPFPAIVAAAALVGWVASRRAPQAFVVGGGHVAGSAAGTAHHEPA